MFLSELPPAETTGYMIAGYAVIFFVMGLYLFSLWLRQRNLQQDLETLDEVSKEANGQMGK
jgi:CcmD family protein